VLRTDQNPNFDDKFKEKVERFFKKDGLEKNYKKNEKKSRLFSKKEVKTAIRQLKSKNSLDNAGTSNRMLKHLPQSGIELFRKLVYKCVENYVIPNLWRDSIITMIIKKENAPTDPTN